MGRGTFVKKKKNYRVLDPKMNNFLIIQFLFSISLGLLLTIDDDR